jgi:hypothetical protein
MRRNQQMHRTVSRGNDDAASLPEWRQAWSDDAGCCSDDPRLVRPSARMPGNATADQDGPPSALRAPKVPSARSLSSVDSNSTCAGGLVSRELSFQGGYNL